MAQSRDIEIERRLDLAFAVRLRDGVDDVECGDHSADARLLADGHRRIGARVEDRVKLDLSSQAVQRSRKRGERQHSGRMPSRARRLSAIAATRSAGRTCMFSKES